MANKHLHNREIELSEETDYFNHTAKGRIIASFFTNDKTHLQHTQMFGLYGEWGSGKSTLMNYIGSLLEQDIEYKTIYFKAWEFEKDNNLPLSLLHYLFDETGITETEIAKKTVEVGFDVFKSLLKSTTIDFKIVKFNLKEAIAASEEYDKEAARHFESQYTNLKIFKEKFALAEKAILNKHDKKKLIIFIDDLDRCEPENVLNLLSSIKLFFTFGRDIIFFFGCDKNAISRAVQTKYGNLIASDEYLEKIFDVSFSMPKSRDLHILLHHYFKGPPFQTSPYNDHTVKLDEFLKSIQFTNPRHLKKVLNKYELINSYRRNLPPAYVGLIPDIIEGSSGELLETIITLFFILLYEFYPDSFFDLEDLERKKSRYSQAMSSSNQDLNQDPKTPSMCAEKIIDVRHGIVPATYTNLTLKNIADRSNENRNKNLPGDHGLDYAYNFVLSLFAPSKIDKFGINANPDGFCKQFVSPENTRGEITCIKFCEYLSRNQRLVLDSKSNYKFENFFQLCKLLL